MIHFFGNATSKVFKPKIEQTAIHAFFVGPRAAMITPWSTNAVEITQNMGIKDIIRIEEFESVTKGFKDFDPMISQKYEGLNQDTFTINIEPEPILDIKDIEAYNQQEGLSLSKEEVEYLSDDVCPGKFRTLPP